MILSWNLKKTKRPQDLTATVAASEKRRMPGHCQGSSTYPTVSVKANFNILHKVLGLVKKLAMRLQIWCALRCRSAHFVSPRQDPGSWKCTAFAWFVLDSVLSVIQGKDSAVIHQVDPGGDEDDLGGGQAFRDQRPVRRRLPAVVGAHWKVHSDRQYICGKFRKNTFLCTNNSFCFISSVAFDFDCTTYVLVGAYIRKEFRHDTFTNWRFICLDYCTVNILLIWLK